MNKTAYSGMTLRNITEILQNPQQYTARCANPSAESPHAPPSG